MIDFTKVECCGCTACVSSCPTFAIKMHENIEGFQEPYVENELECIECGLCERVCPVLNVKYEDKNWNEKAYIVQNIDEKVRSESASGGAFSAIAEYVLKQKGIVYGAAYDENFFVRHICVDSSAELWKLRHSKYVQSNLDGVFKDIKGKLDRKLMVCFSGTPCQVEGLCSFLGKKYSNLILVDVCCHGVSSPMIWKKYVEMNNHYMADNIFFRWKHYGYKYSTMSFFKDNKEVYFSGVESDPMLRAYFSNNCDRKSCYDCAFKKRFHKSDFTIWDCFQPRFFNKEFDDDKGTTSVLVNSNKGEKIILNLMDTGSVRACEVLPQELVYGNKELVTSVKCGSFRDELLRDAIDMEGKELFEKYFEIGIRQYVKKMLRLFLIKSGLYKIVKYAIYSKRRKRNK